MVVHKRRKLLLPIRRKNAALLRHRRRQIGASDPRRAAFPPRKKMAVYPPAGCRMPCRFRGAHTVLLRRRQNCLGRFGVPRPAYSSGSADDRALLARREAHSPAPTLVLGVDGLPGPGRHAATNGRFSLTHRCHAKPLTAAPGTYSPPPPALPDSAA